MVSSAGLVLDPLLLGASPTSCLDRPVAARRPHGIAQYSTRACPAGRQLRVLHGIGDQAIDRSLNPLPREGALVHYACSGKAFRTD
ncbi:MAG: hypothetical protein JW751_28745 [Polyangiaceae bacterium]|nr:hypothetical protein [Polyangiaceae bacterium]